VRRQRQQRSGGGGGMVAEAEADKRLICSFSVLCLPQNKHVHNKLDNGAHTKKCHIYICMETIHYLQQDPFEWHHFFVLGTDQTYYFEWHRIFFIGHRFLRRTFNRLIKLRENR
jgi:hypothetical protein